MNQQLKELSDEGQPRPFAMGARDKTAPSDMPLYQRGETSKPAASVPRGFLQVVEAKGMPITDGSGRRELAEWIASAENPLTARVMTNRVWHHLFGRGLVASVDNFGTTGEKPSNIALLDHLTARFVEGGWSVKKLIREIMLSRAYGLSTNHEPANHSTDPENTLVWRMTPRRLDAESARDAMLAISGKLETTPPVGSTPARIGDNFAGIATVRAANEAISDCKRQSGRNDHACTIPLPSEQSHDAIARRSLVKAASRQAGGRQNIRANCLCAGLRTRADGD